MKNKVIAIVMLTFLNGTLVFANGGVSDGGGGTTNPNPIEPKVLQHTIENQSKILLMAFLNSTQNQVLVGRTVDAPIDPAKELLVKNFDRTLKILRDTPVELKQNEPCFDRNGQPFDGSVYSSVPGAICLSSFTMAPKLTDYNYQAETAALMMHELAHKLGADESMATAIQRLAISFLKHQDYNKLISNFGFFGYQFGTLGNTIVKLKNVNESLHQQTQRSIKDMHNELYEMSLGEDTQRAFRNETLTMLNAEFYRLEVIQLGVCIHSNLETVETKKDCQAMLQVFFRNETRVSAYDIALRTSSHGIKDHYKKVVISRPVNLELLTIEVDLLIKFLKAMTLEAQQTYLLRTKIFNN